MKLGHVVWLFFTCIQTFAAAVAIPVAVTSPGPGFISLALLDANGVLVRTLAYAEPVSAGTRTFYWDATTDLGWPASPGAYTTRAIFFTHAPKATFLTKVGTRANVPWRVKSGTGDWGGDLGGPSAIVANNSSLVVAWSAVENYTLPGIQQVDSNGNVLRSYISFYPWDGRLAGAMDDSHLFLGILHRDAEKVQIARYELGTSNKAIIATLPTPPHYTRSGRWKNRWESMLDGLAVTPTRIYASMAADDRLFILDRDTGAVLQQIAVPSPRGLAIYSNYLLVVGSNGVRRFTLDGAFVSTLVAGAPLEDPYAICVDRSGNVYISDGGSEQFDPERVTGNQQVHVFSAQGVHLRSLGRPGGSPRSGAYIRQAFGQVRAMCIGPDDKLWVNEEITGLKRTSRWNTNGMIEREWFQRKLTHHADLVNPGRPSELIYVGDGFDDAQVLTAYTIDWASGTWEPAWSYAQKQEDMYQEDVYLSNMHPQPLQEYQPGKRYPSFQFKPRELVTYQGRHYFLNYEGNGDGAMFSYTGTNAPQPVAMVGYHRVDVITNRIVSYYDNGPNQWFTWADADGNGRMAMNECNFTTDFEPLSASGRMYEATLETNLSIRMLRPIGNGILIESVLPLKQLLPNGAPVYDWSMLQDVTLHQMPNFDGGAGEKPVSHVNYDAVPLVVGNAAYALLDPGTDEPLELPSLDHFWADRNWRKRVVRFERDTGKFLWAAGRRAPARAQRGEMYNPFALSYSHGTIFAADVLGMVWLWSDQGLYLGRLLHDAEPGRTWDEYAIHAEVQGPVTLVTNSSTGKLYFIVNDTGAHVYEVSLPNLQSLPTQSVTVTPQFSAAAQPWDPDLLPPLPGSILAARITGSGLTLSWNGSAGGMTLQSASNVNGGWSDINATKTTNSGTVSVTLPAGASRQFYRLRQ